MNEFHSPETGRTDDGGRDPWLTEVLRALDPGAGDPGYWNRFHARVMAGTRDELARRRMMADVTVSELVTSWGRALVPAAVAAAAVASFLMLQPTDDRMAADVDAPIALEEMLEERGEMEPLFASGRAGDGAMSVTFASDGF